MRWSRATRRIGIYLSVLAATAFFETLYVPQHGDPTNNGGCGRSGCENVTMYSLDTYVEKFVPVDRSINYLSIDVEGWDYQVLLGGNKTLRRTHYLEFEYNWMGPWAGQPLSEAIEHLHEQYGFVCYWAGFNNTIWRITNCWLDHYDIHFWSNVACVNRNFAEVNNVADSMENLFLDTMQREDAVRDFEHQYTKSK